MKIHSILSKLGLQKKDYVTKTIELSIKQFDLLPYAHTDFQTEPDHIVPPDQIKEYAIASRLGNMLYACKVSVGSTLDFAGFVRNDSFADKIAKALSAVYDVNKNTQFAKFPYENTFTEGTNGWERDSAKVSELFDSVNKLDGRLKHFETKLQPVTLGQVRLMYSEFLKGAKILEKEQIMLGLLLSYYGQHPIVDIEHGVTDLNHQPRCFLIGTALASDLGFHMQYAKPKHLTDILRISGFLSAGILDIRKNIKYIKPTPEIREFMVETFRDKCSEDELARNQEQWKRLNYYLGIKKDEVSEKTWGLIKRLHGEGAKLRSFESWVNHYTATGNLEALIGMLATRPNELIAKMSTIYNSEVFCSKDRNYLLNTLRNMDEFSIRKMSVTRCLKAAHAFSYINTHKTLSDGSTYINSNGNVDGELEKLLTYFAQSNIGARYRNLFAGRPIKVTSKLGDVVRLGIPTDTQKKTVNIGVPTDTIIKLGKASEVAISVGLNWEAYVDLDLSAIMLSDTFKSIGVYNWQSMGTTSSSTLYHSGDVRSGGPNSVEIITANPGELFKPGHLMLLDVRNYSGSPLSGKQAKLLFNMRRSNLAFSKKWDPSETLLTFDLETESHSCNPFMCQVDSHGDLMMYFTNASIDCSSTLTASHINNFRNTVINNMGMNVLDLIDEVTVDNKLPALEVDVNSPELKQLFA